jgi:hypothetical protein
MVTKKTSSQKNPTKNRSRNSIGYRKNGLSGGKTTQNYQEPGHSGGQKASKEYDPEHYRDSEYGNKSHNTPSRPNNDDKKENGRKIENKEKS